LSQNKLYPVFKVYLGTLLLGQTEQKLESAGEVDITAGREELKYVQPPTVEIQTSSQTLGKMKSRLTKTWYEED